MTAYKLFNRILDSYTRSINENSITYDDLEAALMRIAEDAEQVLELGDLLRQMIYTRIYMISTYASEKLKA